MTIDEAVEMWERVHERVHCELLVCEKEGHGVSSLSCDRKEVCRLTRINIGFKQKSVIEFTNAAKVQFLEKHLLGRT